MAIDMAVWGPPLAVLGAGAVVSFLMLQRMNAAGDEKIAAESRRIDLESTRAEVVEALKQLELDREKMPPEEYEAERQRLVARGARALEALETGGAVAPAAGAPAPAAPVAPPPPVPVAGLAPEWKGAIYTLLGVGILAILWNMAQDESAPRGDGGMTGSLPGEDRQAQAQVDPQDTPEFKARLAEAEAAIQANPNDVAALNKITQLYVTHGNPGKGMEYNDQALKLEAENADAKTWRAVITAMMGMFDAAITKFDEVLAQHPQHTLAVTYRGLVLLQMASDEADPAKQKELAQRSAEDLGMAAHLQPGNRAVRQAHQQAQMMASGGAPAGGPPAPGERFVAGTLQIDPAARATLKGGETLFLSIADPTRPGPPIAAESVSGPLTFPMPFELTAEDIRAMPGASTTVPNRMDLKVRVDLDGNAMTKEPGTPGALVAGVTRGQTGLTVTLTVDGASAPGAAPPPMAPPAVPPSGGDVIASGKVKVDPSVKLTGSEIVFVSVRDPAGGPPLASVKLAASFPLDFTVTTANQIAMGGAPRPLPPTFNVTVRADGDGDPMTKDGPEASATGVSKGATGIDLTLKSTQ